MKKKAFTLIELIAVLVILAILALIVTPLVMNIIRKARISADKRSIDAYGRSIELAIASYLLDNGKFPTSIDELSIEYSGDKVVCSTTRLNSDSSVYLAGCTVAGRNIENYTYGEDKTPPAPTYNSYSVGDQVTYNGVDYYVIENSGETKDTVTMLKAEPLSYEDLQTYSAGTDAQISNQNGYGGMAYYTSETCNNGTYSGCTTDYEESEIKYVVDAWVTAKVPSVLDARLLTYDDLLNNLGYENNISCTAGCYYSGSLDNVPTWVYINYWYWTMSPNNDSTYNVWYVDNDGGFQYNNVTSVGNPGWIGGVIRPVIVLPKSAL